MHFLLQPRDPVDFELPTELIVEQNFHGATNISQSPNITAVVDCEGETSELCTSLLFTAGPGIDAGPGESTPTSGPALVNGSLHSALPNQTYNDPNVCSHARGANETGHEASPGVSTPFQIFVQTPSGLLTVDVDPSTLIEKVSNAVVVKLGRPASEFRLHFGGKALDAWRTISDYGIHREATLGLSPLLLGGGKRGKRKVQGGASGKPKRERNGEKANTSGGAEERGSGDAGGKAPKAVVPSAGTSPLETAGLPPGGYEPYSGGGGVLAQWNSDSGPPDTGRGREPTPPSKASPFPSSFLATLRGQCLEAKYTEEAGAAALCNLDVATTPVLCSCSFPRIILRVELA